MASPRPASQATIANGGQGRAWMRLDGAGRVLEYSAAARAVLAAHRGALQLSQGRLRVPGGATTLEPLLAEAAAGKVAATLLRQPGRLPLVLRCRADPAGFVLELRDPEGPDIDATLLRALFGLTVSQAQVAIALCKGQAPADIARSLGVQANTVNAHIKHVLAKTGTARQAQLVALILSGLADLGDAP